MHYIIGTYFFSRWPEITVGYIVWHIFKLWGQLANLKWMKFLNLLLFYNIWDLDNQKICSCHQLMSLRGQEQTTLIYNNKSARALFPLLITFCTIFLDLPILRKNIKKIKGCLHTHSILYLFITTLQFVSMQSNRQNSRVLSKKCPIWELCARKSAE